MRRPARVRPVTRRRGQRKVPPWAIAAAGLGLLLGGTGITATVVAPAAPATAPTAGALECTGAAGPVGEIAGFRGTQLVHAAAIVAAGKEMGVPERGWVIAVATGMQESKLRIYANDTVSASLSMPHEAVGSDYDSTGIFQQRQRGWGTLAQRMDAKGSARLFYNALLKVPGWQSLPLTVAAQRVQISAHPDRYAQWEGPAKQVVAATSSGITCTETRS